MGDYSMYSLNNCNNCNHVYGDSIVLYNQQTSILNALSLTSSQSIINSTDAKLLSQLQYSTCIVLQTNVSHTLATVSSLYNNVLSINTSIDNMSIILSNLNLKDYNASIIDINDTIDVLFVDNEEINVSMTNISERLTNIENNIPTFLYSLTNLSTRLSITNTSVIQLYNNVSHINTSITNISTILSISNTSVIQIYDNVSHINSSITNISTILSNFAGTAGSLLNDNIWTGNNTFNNILNVSIVNTIADNSILMLGGTNTSYVQTNASLIANKGIILSDNQYITTNNTYTILPNVSQMGYFKNNINESNTGSVSTVVSGQYVYSPYVTTTATIYASGIYLIAIIGYIWITTTSITEDDITFNINLNIVSCNDNTPTTLTTTNIYNVNNVFSINSPSIGLTLNNTSWSYPYSYVCNITEPSYIYSNINIEGINMPATTTVYYKVKTQSIVKIA